LSLSAVDSRRAPLAPGPETSSPGPGAALARGAGPGAGAASRPSSLAGIVRAYVALCKPRIVELLLITAVPVLFLADRGLPSPLQAAVVVIGGAMAAGSANALNCYIDRDIDQVMQRTRGRPLVRHSVSPRAALTFGTVLGVVSVGLFAAAANPLAAGLTLGAIVYYVVIYTMLLKRRTPQSTLWGGICGAAPVPIAWATATGSLSWPAFLLFLVVFFWQPPHFWALAVKYRDDYASVGVPMLPVVTSLRRVLTESVAYSWLMVIASVAVWPLATGPVYGVAAVVLGGAFLAEIHRLHLCALRGSEPRTMRMFHASIIYLTLLFAALAAGSLIR
jgi:protoheme IX farnesyltransferase